MVFVLMSVTVPSLKPPPCQRDAASNILTKSCPPATTLAHGWFYFALYMMALGAGGIKACVSTFAGDQFDETDAAEAMRKLSYPNWRLLSISIGSTLAISVAVYIQDAVVGFGGLVYQLHLLDWLRQHFFLVHPSIGIILYPGDHSCALCKSSSLLFGIGERLCRPTWSFCMRSTIKTPLHPAPAN